MSVAQTGLSALAIAWIPMHSEAKDGVDEKRAAEVFRYTFGSAAKVGFDVLYERTRAPGGCSGCRTSR